MFAAQAMDVESVLRMISRWQCRCRGLGFVNGLQELSLCQKVRSCCAMALRGSFNFSIVIGKHLSLAQGAAPGLSCMQGTACTCIHDRNQRLVSQAAMELTHWAAGRLAQPSHWRLAVVARSRTQGVPALVSAEPDLLLACLRIQGPGCVL
jgi:hypothetical protein